MLARLLQAAASSAWWKRRAAIIFRRNQGLRLELLPSGAEYDPNFYGGVDELLPNDIPELIDGIECPDHGELWTTPLKATSEGDRVKMECVLPNLGLRYERWMRLRTTVRCSIFAIA